MSAALSLEQLARVLGGVVSGDQVLCPGPGHTPKDQSLAVKLANDQDGFVCYSHAGNPWPECKDYVRRKLGLQPFNGETASASSKSRIVRTHDYVSEGGNPLHQVVRFEPKGFSQRRRPRPDDNPSKIKNGWIWNLDGVERVLYRLPQVIEWVKEGKTICIVEGEKGADALVKLGWPATCSSGGACKWHLGNYSRYLKGADVVILPDNDAPGENHCDEVGASLHGVAARTRVLRLAGLPPG
jgi:hypothetical protein